MAISKQTQKLEVRRKEAVRFVLQDKEKVREVARRFRVTPQAIYKWCWRYEEHGDDGLRSKARPGRPGRLTPQEKKKLEKILLRGAERAGFSTDLWTCPRICEVIHLKFGIRYHVDHIGRLLHSLGWSPQRPARKAIERDEKRIQNWVRYTWPRIKKKPGRKRPGSFSSMSPES